MNTKAARQYRRQLLALLDGAKATGWLRGAWLQDVLGIEDGGVLAGLLTDLVNLGMAEVQDVRTNKHQCPGLTFSEYRVTAKGTRLLAGGEPVEPLIDDQRIG